MIVKFDLYVDDSETELSPIEAIRLAKNHLADFNEGAVTTQKATRSPLDDEPRTFEVRLINVSAEYGSGSEV